MAGAMALKRKGFEKYLANIWQKLIRGEKYEGVHSEEIQRFLPLGPLTVISSASIRLGRMGERLLQIC